MGAVLLQKKEDSKKHPIAYYSKTLSAAEHDYDIYDLELLAIVNAMDHWRPYLAGSPHKVIYIQITKTYYTGKNHTRLVKGSQGKYSCYWSITLKFIISKELPTEEQMHYPDDRTTTKDMKTTKMSPFYQKKYLYEQWKYSQTPQIRRTARYNHGWTPISSNNIKGYGIKTVK
jgi:hypothetical protein